MTQLFINSLMSVKLINMLRYIIAMLLFSRRLPRQGHFMLRALGWTVLCMAAAFLLPVFTDQLAYVTLLFLIECLLSIGIVPLCHRTDWAMVLYVASAAFSAEHIASMLDSLVALAKPDVLSYVITGKLNPWILLNYALSMVLVYGIIYRLMFHRSRLTDDHNLSFNALLLLLVISLAVNLWMNLIYSELVPERSFWISLFEYGFNILCSAFLLRIQAGMLHESQMEKRLQITNMLWEQAREQYRISKENIDAINIKCHDLRHRLLAIEGMSETAEYADIMETIDSYGSQISTNNEVLDVIFQEKNFQCRKLGIQFTCIIDGAALNFMDKTDLYVLFGNLIDNCIEAVSKLEEGEVKNVQVTVRRDKGFVIIATENGYVGQLLWSGGRLRTSKSDADNHGFGMLSIENIVHKYQGRYSIGHEDHIFYMNIVFPVNALADGQTA